MHGQEQQRTRRNQRLEVRLHGHRSSLVVDIYARVSHRHVRNSLAGAVDLRRETTTRQKLTIDSVLYRIKFNVIKSFIFYL